MVIRLAEPPDAIGVAQVHVRSWQLGCRGLMPDDYLDQLQSEDERQSTPSETPTPANQRQSSLRTRA